MCYNTTTMSKTYTFCIEGCTPKTIPGFRFAVYLQNFAQILGHPRGVHFHNVTKGRTKIALVVDPDSERPIEEHLSQQARGGGNTAAIKARRKINKMLAEDKTTGYIYEGADTECRIIDFPGVNMQRQETFGPFCQQGSLDGILTGIIGVKEKELVQIHLDRGKNKLTEIEANRKIACELVQHLFKYVRIFGTETRLRNENGIWILKKFQIDKYKILRTSKLTDVMNQMQAVEGSEWKKMEDPLAVWRRLRDGGDGDY